MKDHEYAWRKSSRSVQGSNANCVVMAANREGEPAVSDSKLPVGERPIMQMGRADLSALLSFVKNTA